MGKRVIAVCLSLALLGCGRIGYDGRAPDAAAARDGGLRDAGARPDGGEVDGGLDPDAGTDAGPDPDLVAWLALDGEPGTEAADAMGLLRNGRCDPGRCPTSAPGVFGNAYEFDGVDDYIRFDTSDVLDFGASDQPFSVSAWYRTRNRGPGVQQVVFAQATSAGDISFQLSFEDLDFGGTYDVVWKVCESSCPDETFAQQVDGVQQDRWVLAVGVWDGSASILYLDGVEVARASTAGVKFDGSPFMLGADWENGGSIEDSFDGFIDDLRIYRRALTPSEQQQLMVGARR